MSEDKIMQETLQNLRVHQIELEMQNEELRRTQAELEQVRSKYFDLYDLAPVGYLTLSETGIILEGNLTAANLLDVSRSELVEKSISQFVHPEDQDRFYLERKKTLKTGRPQDFDLRMMGQNKGVFWAHLRGILDPAPAGAMHFKLVISDATQRVKDEESLKETLYLFSESQKAGLVGSFKLNLSKGTWESTPTLDQILGIDDNFKRDIPGVTALIHPDDKSLLDGFLINQSLLEGASYEKEFQIIRQSDSQPRWVRVLGQSKRSQNGKDLVQIGVVQDISENKKNEARIQRAQNLESLGLLAGGVAHDFNNLLTGIFGYVDLALNHVSDEGAKLYLDKIRQVQDRARGLTQQLLTFAKGGAPLKRTEHLFPFIKEIVQFSLSGSSVSCEYKIDAALFPCHFDRTQIAQVLGNLVINAVQAMPNGGSIVVGAENVSFLEGEFSPLAQGDYVKISLRDQGIGIPAEQICHIFDPYFTTKPKGMGLGLPTCYSIIKKHGGVIAAESRLGEGSLFYFFLPASHEPLYTPELTTLGIHRGHGTILVMDDDWTIRDLITEHLKALGYRVLGAANGNEVVKILGQEISQNSPIVGALLDLTIPGGMGGVETLGKLRELGIKIPVFVMSGYADDTVLLDPNHEGFSGSLKKPFGLEDLTRLLDKFLPGKGEVKVF